MIQLDLFQGASHLNRACDPQTSVEAAEALPLGECQAVALEAARYVVRQYGDATANEIAVRAASMSCRPAETFRKRVHELVRRGKLRHTKERACSITGKSCQVYEVVE